MKVLSLEEIETINTYSRLGGLEDAWELLKNGQLSCLLHTAREYHRLREALEKIVSSYAFSEPGDPYRTAREALKESAE